MRIITLLYLGLIINFLLTGCKTSEKVISKTETTLEIRHREIPVAIPERTAAVAGLIKVDSDGNFSLEKFKIENDQGVVVDISISPDGELNADFIAKGDSITVAATDSIKSDKILNEKETERKPSFIQRFGAYIGWCAFGAFIIIGIVLVLRNKIKRLWQ